VSSLGDLGKPRVSAGLTFGWFGATIRVSDAASDLVFLDFIASSSGVSFDPDNLTPGQVASASTAIMDYLRSQVHADDWAEFWRLAKDNGQTIEDLMTVARSITEAVSRFPTGRPTASLSGPPSTPERSEDVSYSPVSPLGIIDPKVDRAFSLLKGRPDLKSVVWDAQAAREG